MTNDVRSHSNFPLKLASLILLLVILLVANFFHPVDDLPVESFLKGDMGHGDSRACAMPVLLFRLEPHHIARSDFFDRAAPF